MKLSKVLLSAATCAALFTAGCKKDDPTTDSPTTTTPTVDCTIESQKDNGTDFFKMDIDAAHRPTRYYDYNSTTGALNGTIDFVYNSNGKLSQYTIKDVGGVSTGSNEFAYNANGKNIQQKRLNALGVPTYITNIEYDGNQRITRIEDLGQNSPPSTALTLSSYTTYNYSGTDAKAISSIYRSINYPSGNSSTTYSYDNNNLTSQIEVRTDNSRTTYQRVFDDKKGGYFVIPGFLLRNSTGTNAPNDIAGKNNIITETYTNYDASNVQTSRTVYNHTYEFDAKGNPIKRTTVPSSGTTTVATFGYHCH
jgi:hypothetical protein